MLRPPRAIALTAALAGVLAVSACGQSSQPAGGGAGGVTSPSASTQPGSTMASTHNDADVAFATDMVPHHAQAVEMAELALTQATSAEVKKLATEIKAAQDPEIQAMSGWLKSWGKPVPSTMAGHGMGSMGSSESGMMSSQEMDDLGKASGTGFDTMWLEMMIRHHRGAVAMAQTELGSGSSAEAKRLAQDIVDAQNKEIAEMTALLGTLKK
ncbi:MAG TPA: DUF305 domain-containing protein [Intrasporangium sp.]|uniref:DUF305 domain-containing protein n=1 Tax=Intrasporangium sp. TaxID=1925024 RepID=UPI002D777DF7|nr:DUF305 domain-containing protein [Intrasporangium sp.]HET7399402.1 DUF305 domain-containing protein [Intrasporangium sp.]